MFYISRKFKSGKYAVTDTYDNVSETYSVSDILECSKTVKIYGVSEDNIRVVTPAQLSNAFYAKCRLLGDDLSKCFPISKQLVLIDTECWQGAFMHNKHDITVKSALKERVLQYNNVLELPKFVLGIEQRYGVMQLNMKKLILPDTIDKLGLSCFCSCCLLEEIEGLEFVKTVGYAAFFNCSALRSIKFGNTLKAIADRAFANCSALENIDLGNSVELIGVTAFESCSSLRSIELPDSVCVLDDYCFQECEYLSTVKLSKGLTKISRGVFRNTALNAVEIPESVQEICFDAFGSCNRLRTVHMPYPIAEIDKQAFNKCKVADVYTCKANEDKLKGVSGLENAVIHYI